MPASTLDPVNAALRTALNNNPLNNNSLDLQLAGSTKKALLANIEFEPAGSYQSIVLDKLKSKYIVLKNSTETPQASKPEEETGLDETLKLPNRQLYPLEAVQLGWNKCDWFVGAGMINMGNTCYLNSTLQALFHVPALVNWLLSDKEHMSECQQDSGGLCIICAMRKTLQDSQQRTTTIRPLLIYNKLRVLCRHLIPGRQEDAHEFLRYLVEAMEKSYLNRFKNHSEFDAKIKETTPLNQILGGYLRSAVQCLKCGHVSTTFQHFQDLLLDIRKAQTLDEALECYFSREKLDDEAYHCQSCKKKVPATKQFSLERAPMVLCIQLKRFSISNNKITKHINFRQRLDLTRYARHRPNVPLIYRLVALVTHMGPTVNCGHYTAVAQAPSGTFYQFDDSMVRNISLQAVFNTNAYIMLYELESSPFVQNNQNNKLIINNIELNNNNNNNNNNTNKISTNGIGFTSNKVYGPELPPDRQQQNKKFNGNLSSSTNGINGSIKSNGKQNIIVVKSTTSSTISSSSSSSSSSSDSETENIEEDSVNNEIKKKPFVQTSLNNNNNRSFTTIPIQNVRKLVDYEADSSCSDESNHSANEIDSRVSTKAAIGEWKASPSSLLITEENSNKHESITSFKTSNGNGIKNWKKKSQNNNSNNNNNTTLNELNKMSHNGYSLPVCTWNGTRTVINKEIDEERREERKRSLADNSDQGRAKHPRIHNTLYKSNPGYNPIQEFHNSKNWNKNNGHFKQYYSNNRRRRNFHHNNFHKNYRFRP